MKPHIGRPLCARTMEHEPLRDADDAVLGFVEGGEFRFDGVVEFGFVGRHWEGDGLLQGIHCLCFLGG